ncbi:hypothetical protein QUA79_07010 [Microcoleus sp. F8-D1]
MRASSWQGTLEQVLPPLVEVKVNPGRQMLSADLQRPRSRYFDSRLSCFYLDRRLDRGLVNAGNRLYCKKVKHLICDNNCPRDRKRGLHKHLGREEQLLSPFEHPYLHPRSSGCTNLSRILNIENY